MNSALLILLLAADARATNDLETWISGSGPPERSIALAQRLPDSPAAIPRSVPDTLSAYTRRTLAAHAVQRLNAAKTDCIASTKTIFAQESIASDDPISAHFFDSAIHMESTFCLEHGTAQEAFNIFRSAEYRTHALPLVVAYEANGDQTCMRTEPALGGTLAPTAFCSQTNVHMGDDFYGVVGWLTENTGGADHQGLFYRHYVIIFIDRPEGGVAGFRGVVTRAKTLGTLHKSVVRISAGKAHDLMRGKLNDALSSQ